LLLPVIGRGEYGHSMLALGIAAAVAASLLYNTSIALQALEAREVPHEHSLRPSLLGRLVRNRRWLGATGLGLLGWPFEIAALLLAPLTVVQPCIASGLVLLLWLGATRLGERPGRREFVAVAAIMVGIAGVAWAAPERTTDHAGAGAIALALVLVALPVLAPYAFRARSAAATLAIVSAGCGYAWTAIASKLLTDELAAGAVLIAIVWLASAAASEGLALLSEMSALQRRPATHVAPVMFAVQVLVPVALAPLIFNESWAGTPGGGAALVAFMAVAVAGTMLLAGSKAVGAVIESARADD
jgi:drug/metabolite transporter (DMT)-like permease